jgi:hypothetical protein
MSRRATRHGFFQTNDPGAGKRNLLHADAPPWYSALPAAMR